MPDATRQRVLAAAAPIFAERGYDRATVRDICDAASVNVASVNYHFGDKRGLYVEVVRHARELREDQVPFPELPADASVADRLRAFVSTMLQRMLGSDALPWQHELMFREMLQPTDGCRAMVEEFFRQRLDLLLNILAPAFSCEMPEHQRQQFAFTVMGQCLFYRVGSPLLEMVIPEQDRTDHFHINQLSQHITNVTMAALGQPLGLQVAMDLASQSDN